MWPHWISWVILKALTLKSDEATKQEVGSFLSNPFIYLHQIAWTDSTLLYIYTKHCGLTQPFYISISNIVDWLNTMPKGRPATMTLFDRSGFSIPALRSHLFLKLCKKEMYSWRPFMYYYKPLKAKHKARNPKRILIKRNSGAAIMPCQSNSSYL